MSVTNCHAHAHQRGQRERDGGRKRGRERGRDLIPYGRIFMTFVDASVWLGGSPRNRTARSHERTRGTLGYHWHFSCNELFRRGKLQVRYRIGFAQYVVIVRLPPPCVCTRALSLDVPCPLDLVKGSCSTADGCSSVAANNLKHEVGISKTRKQKKLLQSYIYLTWCGQSYLLECIDKAACRQSAFP